MTWQPGETIVHTEHWQGRLWAARPLTVVEDVPDRLLLWLPHGTVRRVPATPVHRPSADHRKDRVIANLAHRDWEAGEHVWDVSSLWILRPGDWHAVWVSWRPTGEHLGWYVNLQTPFERTDIGIESMDLMLDVVADPDLSWRWKDDDEFDEIAERGIFEPELVARVRAEAERVIGRIEGREPPFDEPWPSWRPDPRWSAPRLPRL